MIYRLYICVCVCVCVYLQTFMLDAINQFDGTISYNKNKLIKKNSNVKSGNSFTIIMQSQNSY